MMTNTDHSRLQLYYYPSCPFCLRVLWQLKRLGIKMPMHNILRDDAAQQRLLQGGGRTTVPCLMISEPGKPVHWLYESADICQFLKQEKEHA